MSPGKIVVAGDWHGNTRWALNVIWESRELLAGEGEKVILQLGDFGIWPGEAGKAYLDQLGLALDQYDTMLLFVPGNHEDYDQIGSWPWEQRAVAVPGTGGRIICLGRGYRWQWHGREWLACGGAASPDRAWRERNGAGWWPGETITREDEEACISGAPADVLVSHDRPAQARLSLPPWPMGWTTQDLARCNASRDAVQRVCEGTQVRHVIHGHYHLDFSSRAHDLGYGPVQVTQLGTDGDARNNYRVLDTVTMGWLKPAGDEEPE